MANEHEPLAAESWDRVAAELRSCRESQHHAWGTLDNATLGCYLAGGGDDDERRAVEQALADHPQLRELTDLVRDVLVEFEPTTAAPLGQTSPTLPFTTILPASARATSR